MFSSFSKQSTQGFNDVVLCTATCIKSRNRQYMYKQIERWSFLKTECIRKKLMRNVRICWKQQYINHKTYMATFVPCILNLQGMDIIITIVFITFHSGMYSSKKYIACDYIIIHNFAKYCMKREHSQLANVTHSLIIQSYIIFCRLHVLVSRHSLNELCYYYHYERNNLNKHTHSCVHYN